MARKVRQRPVAARFLKIRDNCSAVQGIGAREDTADRAVGQHGFIFVDDGFAVIARGVPGRPLCLRLPQHNRRAVGKRRALYQLRKRLA